MAAFVKALGLDIHQLIDEPEIFRDRIESAIPDRNGRNWGKARTQKWIKLVEMK